MTQSRWRGRFDDYIMQTGWLARKNTHTGLKQVIVRDVVAARLEGSVAGRECIAGVACVVYVTGRLIIPPRDYPRPASLSSCVLSKKSRSRCR